MCIRDRATLAKPETLAENLSDPKSVASVEDFITMDDAALSALLSSMGPVSYTHLRIDRKIPN